MTNGHLRLSRQFRSNTRNGSLPPVYSSLSQYVLLSGCEPSGSFVEDLSQRATWTPSPSPCRACAPRVGNVSWSSPNLPRVRKVLITSPCLSTFLSRVSLVAVSCGLYTSLIYIRCSQNHPRRGSTSGHQRHHTLLSHARRDCPSRRACHLSRPFVHSTVFPQHRKSRGD